MSKPDYSSYGRPINQSYDDNEPIARCRFCGYQVSDHEKEERGVYRLSSSGVLLAEYYSCVFCPEVPITMGGDKSPELPMWQKVKRFFSPNRWAEAKIHGLKKSIRDILNESPLCKRLSVRKEFLEKNFGHMIFHTPYRSDAFGYKIKNAHEAEYDKIQDELSELKQSARIAYYDCLGKLGSSDDDEAPATRKLNLKQKKKLIKYLEEKLTQFTAYRGIGLYD